MTQISILVTVHNRVAFLSQALDSLLSQTYRDWHCLIYDDASTDDSAAIAQQYCDRDPRFELIQSPVQEGFATALHTSIMKATTPYVGILDSDDWLEPRCLEMAIAPFQSGFDVGHVYTDFYVVQNGKKSLGYIARPFDDQGQFDANKMVFPGYCPFHFHLFRRIEYLKTDGIDLALEAAVGYDLMLKLSEVCRFYHVPHPLYNYRVHPGQVSQTKTDLQLLRAKQVSQAAIDRRGLPYRAKLGWGIEAI